jgi:hypothetical protein
MLPRDPFTRNVKVTIISLIIRATNERRRRDARSQFRAVLRGAARILLAEGAGSRINVKF